LHHGIAAWQLLCKTLMPLFLMASNCYSICYSGVLALQMEAELKEVEAQSEQLQLEGQVRGAAAA
jgi:hypothetical protein